MRKRKKRNKSQRTLAYLSPKKPSRALLPTSASRPYHSKNLFSMRAVKNSGLVTLSLYFFESYP
ncbi:MAG: hypothetical protein K9K75_03165, partial [Deltaproteobacteria bacterium]|nr:hypothetical protein [Deltaproteobacteria bacterium]